jgi:hypothetical protein
VIAGTLVIAGDRPTTHNPPAAPELDFLRAAVPLTRLIGGVLLLRGKKPAA